MLYTSLRILKYSLIILSWGASESQVIATAIVAVTRVLGGGMNRGPLESAMKNNGSSALGRTVLLSTSFPSSTEVLFLMALAAIISKVTTGWRPSRSWPQLLTEHLRAFEGVRNVSVVKDKRGYRCLRWFAVRPTGCWTGPLVRTSTHGSIYGRTMSYISKPV